MKINSVLMTVSSYPATFGHTAVINNLCKGLTAMGIRTGIGAFSFKQDPPPNVEKVILKKSKLLIDGVKSLDFDIIDSHQPRICYYLLFKTTNKPVLLHYHGASNAIQKSNFKLLMKLYKSRISKLIAVSETAHKQICEMVGEASVEVVHNGVNNEFYNAVSSNEFRKGEPQLLFVGGLRKYKKTAFLVKSMIKLLNVFPNAHLQIVGNGEEFQNLKTLIQKKELENNVELVGQLNEKDLRLRYSSCDIYVSASTFETFPVPSLEAMACGKPLVLSEHTAHKEVIERSKAGLIFRYEDEFDFCNKVKEVYEQREKYKISAKQFAQYHDWSIICSRLIELYSKLI